MSNSGETNSVPRQSPDRAKPCPNFPSQRAKEASDQFDAIKEALIGPKPPDDKGQKTWVLPKEEPKTKFSTP